MGPLCPGVVVVWEVNLGVLCSPGVFWLLIAHAPGVLLTTLVTLLGVLYFIESLPDSGVLELWMLLGICLSGEVCW